jgi:hypothetical protein
MRIGISIAEVGGLLAAVVLIAATATIMPIVGVVLAGLILTGLALLRARNSNNQERVPVRVRSEYRRSRRR